MEKSTAGIKIHQFIINYGDDQLISWLDHFDKVIKSKDYPLYRKIERESCAACAVSLADMRRSKKDTDCINAKRIISFLAFHRIGLNIHSIANLLKLSDRMINYYIKEAEEWINEPKANRGFVESYNKVIDKIQIQ